MKESEKIYQIKTIGFENGKKVEKAVCINDSSETNLHTFKPKIK